MVVFIFEKVPATLRGEMSRWLVEPRAGVFVGRVSGVVRDKLWETARRRMRGGGGTMLFPSPTEQGFTVRTFGDTKRTVVTLDGLSLVHVPKAGRLSGKEDEGGGEEGNTPVESEPVPSEPLAETGQERLFD